MQTKSLLLTSKYPKSGMRMISMGLMTILKREVQDVAFFKPVVEDCAQDDGDIQFITNYFKLKQKPQTAYGLTIKEIKTFILKDQVQAMYEKILQRYNKLLQEYDFVLCQGSQNSILDELIEGDLDIQIVKNLQMPMMEIISGFNTHSVEEFDENIDSVIHAANKHDVTLLGIFINRVNKKILKENTQKTKNNIPLFILPEIPELDRPTMQEIKTGIEAVLLCGDEEMLDRSVNQNKVAAMTLDHYLTYLEEGDLIIVPGDRSDIIVGTFLANLSRNYPSLAGMLLTGGMKSANSIKILMEETDIPMLPIIGIDTDTESAVLKVQSVLPQITLLSERKIALAQGLFNDYVDNKILKKRLLLTAPKTMTPVRFSYMLYEKARASKSHILLPEGEDERILRAADNVLRRGLCDITLLGNPQKIMQHCSLLGLDLSKAKVVDPNTWENMEEFVETFYQLRKHKGIIKQVAREIVSRRNYFATMFVYLGYADGMVSGATHTTRETIKPAFEIIKMQEGVKLISSLFFMLLGDKVLVYGDCAVNPDPNAKELASIAISSAKTAKTFGIDPKVAMLSYSSGDSGVGVDVEKVKKASEIARQEAPDFLIEGPMQYDTAIDSKVAAQKMPNSKVAGSATVFIFPDLNTGNNTYKAVQRSANAIAIGPILQGLKKPVNDLSRGCSVEDVVHTIAITAIQAATIKEE